MRLSPLLALSPYEPEHAHVRLRAIVPGHRSELAFGQIGDVPVVAMLGRVWPLSFFTTTAEDTDSSPVSCL